MFLQRLKADQIEAQNSNAIAGAKLVPRQNAFNYFPPLLKKWKRKKKKKKKNHFFFFFFFLLIEIISSYQAGLLIIMR